MDPVRPRMARLGPMVCGNRPCSKDATHVVFTWNAAKKFLCEGHAIESHRSSLGKYEHYLAQREGS